MKVTIDLPYDTYKYLELRAAIDDLTLADGIAILLTEIVTRKKPG